MNSPQHLEKTQREEPLLLIHSNHRGRARNCRLVHWFDHRVIAGGLLLLLGAINAFADSSTWTPSSGASAGDWNTASNWSPSTVPNGPADIATFAHSFTTFIFISADTEVDQITFVSSMFPTAYTTTVSPGAPNTVTTLTISGTGIINNSGFVQNFVTGADSGSVGEIDFRNSATAGTSTTFTTNGAVVAGGNFGSTWFLDNSSAGNATIVANGGTNGGGSGLIVFRDNSQGQNARLKFSGNESNNGHLDISGHDSPGVSVGSIEGNGNIFLGGNQLTVGGNNLSTTFSGILTGPGGSLRKVGNGRFSLNRSSGNPYNGGTVVNGGTLFVNNMHGSGTGPGPVQVSSGTLAGAGFIQGVVTLGTKGSSGATLFPGTGNKTSIPGTLTTGPVRFRSGSTYKCVLNRSSGEASQLSAFGVTINSGVPFTFVDTGSGTLPVGTVFIVINNTSSSPITGAFSNLPDGLVLTSNGNNFKVSYTGETGNDLTLEIVP